MGCRSTEKGKLYNKSTTDRTRFNSFFYGKKLWSTLYTVCLPNKLLSKPGCRRAAGGLLEDPPSQHFQRGGSVSLTDRISTGLNFLTLGQISKKNVVRQIETILHICDKVSSREKRWKSEIRKKKGNITEYSAVTIGCMH